MNQKSNKNRTIIFPFCSFSAGIGRTGTYIGLDALYEEGAITQYVNVVQYVKKMRYSRMNMIQTQVNLKRLLYGHIQIRHKIVLID